MGLLLTFALVRGLPAPRWTIPAALAALLVDAVWTLPAGGPGHSGYVWVLQPSDAGVDMPSGFESALSACWAPLAAVALFLLAWRHGGERRRRPLIAAAVLAGFSVTGYAVVRVIDIWLEVRARHVQSRSIIDVTDTVTAVILAVLPPLVLGLTAVALVVVLAGHGRRLAAAGAFLLAVSVLPSVDASLGAVPLPLYAGDRTALFSWHAITPTLAMMQPVLAVTTLVEMTALLLLIAGIVGWRGPARADQPSPAARDPRP
ncbi:hypothetical protein AB0M36_24725 [Actinoplanes sp. NPDC051346]|uniref:hypothetical protein n=1 Tax=Actinoplanes sp. NPDC051346 TaxID=3155048 RepID=UPI003420AA91